MSKNRSGQFISGLLLGGVIGTVTGLLIAPRTGRQTRQLLKKSVEALPELAEDLSTSVQLQADRFSESTRSNWDETLEKLRQAIAAGVEAGSREREHLSAKEVKRSPDTSAAIDELMDADNGLAGYSPSSAPEVSTSSEFQRPSQRLGDA
uniref:YtxH domain-containing protein n=1 Tax=Desertifilum tharense IPPAS B-1220 TaxID=1781255 RepID=A0ACD5GNP5_9CYAN